MRRLLLVLLLSLNSPAGADTGPPPGGWPTHEVQRGQTLWAVSKLYGTTVEALVQANGLEGTELKAGQTLLIPVHPDTISVWVQVRTEDGTPAWVQRRHLMLGSLEPAGRERVLDLARKFTGVPYRWGGQSPNGADCSGFVHEVFRLAGYSIPRMADQQYEDAEEVETPAPGDLVFFSTYEPGPSHVGIYVGEGRFVHASSSQGVSEASLDEDYFKERFLGARRPRGLDPLEDPLLVR